MSGFMRQIAASTLHELLRRGNMSATLQLLQTYVHVGAPSAINHLPEDINSPGFSFYTFCLLSSLFFF